MRVLVVNCGSSSIKYQVFDMATETAIHRGMLEHISTPESFKEGMHGVLEDCRDQAIDAVGHRVVHGGDTFHDAVVIDDEVINHIDAWSPFAPLHNPRNLAGIRACREERADLPQVAVFDTAFHAGLPRRASTYALDVELAAAHKIRRYGFHGTSHQFVAQEAARYMRSPLADLRIVTLHLGNGASACAVEYGHSTETSMGMTPLEGLVMGTRCGDIGAGVVLTLMRNTGKDVDALDDLLNKQSGLKGLSGLGNDLREIEARAADGDDRARLAISVFAHKAKKYIGSYAAAMGGLDAVVLTGGIGENSAVMRRRILQRLDFLGVALDEDRNRDALSDESLSEISSVHSRVKAFAIRTNEELMIARQTLRLLKSQDQASSVPIPIAVSGRHAHLDPKTFAALFGADAEPKQYKDLSQPGQFACVECVNLIGPCNRIDGVRLLGPLRSKNQIEISRTDEFTLGVDAPVRDSGQVKDSAPIILEGPAGQVQLSEGLICARRHIHMHPDDAERYGLADRDEVEVGIHGGPRDLVFCDVLVRVSPKYRLEMHIDTDEANAAELKRRADGVLVEIDLAEASAELRRRSTRCES